MLKITRTLQKQIEEKEAKITDYKSRIHQLQGEEDSRRTKTDAKFESEKSELQRKQKEEEELQENKIQELQDQEQTLLEFKNTQMVAKKQRQNLEQRYKMLLRKLTEVERQGAEDVKRQKIMMDNEYA